jgi:uncharacterized protein (TIGR03435 family)
MSAIRILSEQPWVGRLGWTLVHFLWQGLAIAALYAGARACAKHSSPNRRYLLGCVALAAMLATPIATYSLLGSAERSLPIPSRTAVTNPHSDPGTTFAVTASESSSKSGAFASIWPERVLPSVVILWVAGTLVFWVRLVGGWITAARLRTQLTRSSPNEWQQTLDRLRTRLRVARPVRLLVSGLVDAPAVVGWLRPVVLVPIGALAGLPAEHLEALLLHELAHIRRHDYLVNVLQSIAEALLFYHPAVWWISGHIRAERELCCDDLAVAATGDAFTYATALADLESYRPAHARNALAANGGRLPDRIARLLGQARPETRMFSAPGAASAVLLAISTCVMFGQPAERPKFEVASVKPTADKARSSSGMRPRPGGRLVAENYSTRMLITNAYHLLDSQVVGGPNWLRDEGFEIDAKGDPSATNEQLMLMLQSLLEDRFQLKYHHETRELSVYALTVGKSGPKLPAPREGGCPQGSTQCDGMFPTASGMSVRGGDMSMPDLVRRLAAMLGRPVLDRTAITTHFAVRLDFAVDDTVGGLTKEWGTVQGHREMMAELAGAAGATGAAPSILTALQDQLGLKLESTRGPVEVMVIDRVEKPSAN